MNEDERNEHFKGFADLLFPEISQLFFTLYARIEEHRPIEEIDAVEDEIKALLAQRGYDLMFHAVKHSLPYQQGDRVVKYIVSSHIPDLTQWSEDEQ